MDKERRCCTTRDLVLRAKFGQDCRRIASSRASDETRGAYALRQDGDVDHRSETIPLGGSSLDDRVQALRDSIAPDVYEPTRFIPRDEVESRVAELDAEISLLQRVVDGGAVGAGALTGALSELPTLLYVLQLLFVSPAGAGFADGRELPEHPVEDEADIAGLASLAIDLGLPWIAPKDRVSAIWLGSAWSRSIRAVAGSGDATASTSASKGS